MFLPEYKYPLMSTRNRLHVFHVDDACAHIEIATALAKDPTILIMDEGTSALDPRTEELVMQHVGHLGITTILIAHRLSTIRDCDCIYVMERGEVLQKGTHEELLSQEGLYKELMKYA